MKKVLHWLLLLVGLAGLVYSWVFRTAVTTNSAVLQLEDSDVIYSVGKAWATADTRWLPTISLLLVVYSVYRLFIHKKMLELLK